MGPLHPSVGLRPNAILGSNPDDQVLQPEQLRVFPMLDFYTMMFCVTIAIDNVMKLMACKAELH